MEKEKMTIQELTSTLKMLKLQETDLLPIPTGRGSQEKVEKNTREPH